MHPPFGFALFYLRGIVPREQVSTADIYRGAIPWVVLQVILVAVLIFWPGLVTGFLSSSGPADLSNIQITLPPDQNTNPSGPPQFDLNTPPSFN
jgi:hypothetical protein